MNSQTIFTCPHCEQALTITLNNAECFNGHSFDVAKEGYLNLLVAGRLPATTTPGDTADSLAARRRFLHAEHYLPIVEAIRELIGTLDGPILDVGCGEGYYLARLKNADRFGIDISKKAVQMASKNDSSAGFAVASSYRLPVRSESCAGVFTVFAPHSFSEYSRVLQKGGRWVTVTPGPHHLMEMRPLRDEAIEEREQRRQNPPEEASEAHRVQFTLDLTEDTALDLFSMTPLRWQTAAHARPVTSVSVDVWVATGINLL